MWTGTLCFWTYYQSACFTAVRSIRQAMLSEPSISTHCSDFSDTRVLIQQLGTTSHLCAELCPRHASYMINPGRKGKNRTVFRYTYAEYGHCPSFKHVVRWVQVLLYKLMLATGKSPSWLVYLGAELLHNCCKERSSWVCSISIIRCI